MLWSGWVGLERMLGSNAADVRRGSAWGAYHPPWDHRDTCALIPWAGAATAIQGSSTYLGVDRGNSKLVGA